MATRSAASRCSPQDDTADPARRCSIGPDDCPILRAICTGHHSAGLGSPQGPPAVIVLEVTTTHATLSADRGRTGTEGVARLATLIARSCDGDGYHRTEIPGLYLTRLSTTCTPRTSIDRALFCVVAQGAKQILLGAERYVYDPSSYLLVPLDLPLVGEIVAATPDRPLLGLTIELDFPTLGALMLEARLPSASPPRPQRQLFVSALDDDLLDAVIRYVTLLQHPEQCGVLAPLIRQEIFYRLLLGEQREFLYRMTAVNGQVGRIAAGIAWLKRNMAHPVRMDDLARELHMSVSTMHAWFRSVTGMSPLQFLKNLRLQEARRVLLTEDADAATVSRRVGYESPSQFSREYRRLFGAPPLRDIAQLRGLAGRPPLRAEPPVPSSRLPRDLEPQRRRERVRPSAERGGLDHVL